MYVKVIRSKLSIIDMLKSLNDTSTLLDEPNDFMIRPICTYSSKKCPPLVKRHIRETNHNLLFSVNELSPKFVEESSLSIVDYSWNNFKSWDVVTETPNLHFKGFPRSMSPESVTESITSVLSFILSESDYTIEAPIAWKNSNTVKGFGSLKFTETVPEHTRKLCKLLLHNMNISEAGNPTPTIISFHWTKDNPSVFSSKSPPVNFEKLFAKGFPIQKQSLHESPPQFVKRQVVLE